MPHTRRTSIKIMSGFSAAALLGASAVRAIAQDTPVVHEVQMLNEHPDDSKEKMVYVPDLIRANPGDTIRFISSNPGHNIQSMKDMLPEGVEKFKSTIGEDYDLVLSVEGAYGIGCTPHSSVGMVMLVLFGDVAGNYEALKELRQNGKAKKRYEDIFARADALLAEEAAAG